MKGAILSLCDYSGNWSRPYAEAGYLVHSFDLARGEDIRLLEWTDLGPVVGILAAPPCDHFSKAGARWWPEKGESAILDGLSVVDACLRAVTIYRPTWWALENPAGRLGRYLGPPAWSFDPCNFGDPWTKRTYLWGHFTPPTPLFAAAARNSVFPSEGDRTTRLSSSQKRLRSQTPAGFATAFFEANP
jgi:hypothetical protein